MSTSDARFAAVPSGRLEGPPLLEARGITKRFGGIAALTDVRFELRPGEVHALMGENGAGKSTLMKILSGVHGGYQGEILVEGRPASFGNVRQAEAAGIGIIHQELNLVPELTVADNILLGREPRRAGLFIDRKAGRAIAADLLGQLGIALDPDARVGSLRVGEQQLVEIAKALSHSGRILFMDEPTSALSPAECERLFEIIRQLAGRGVAIVYTTHRLDEVMRLADRVTVFRDGRHVLTRPIGEIDQDGIIAAMVGRELLAAERVAESRLETVALSVRDLTLDVPHRQGQRRVLHGVSFDLREGEILGIGGLLGSGRTEILASIFGAAIGTVGGEIAIGGQPVRIASPRDGRRHGLAFVTEDRKSQGLHLASSIADNIALPLVARLASFGLRSVRAEHQLAQQAVGALGIRCAGIDQPAGRLSGGNQQKVVMGKWLATRPRILLLDEPTRGIDVGAKREIYDLIFALARDEGLAILVVSSELPELIHLADRILVMAEGRQTGMLSRQEASEERIMRLAAPRHRFEARAAA